MPTVAIGNDGSATLPSGHSAHLNAWSASISRVNSVITGFTDDGVRRRLGVQDITGSASGHPHFGSANTEPGADEAEPGGALTLLIATGCSYQPTVVFDSIDFAVDKTGDSTIVFNFGNADGEDLTETWAVS